MAQIKIDLDQTTYEALVKVAVGERRPIPWQAEHMLSRALSRRIARQPLDGQDRRTFSGSGLGDPDGPRAA